MSNQSALRMQIDETAQKLIWQFTKQKIDSSVAWSNVSSDF